MTTQKELLEKHREGLDEAYHKKYPNGKFVLQEFEHAEYIALHWCPKRNTGAVHKRGISVRYCTGERYAPRCGSNKIWHDDYQNNSFGRCYNYDTIEKLLAACIRHNFPGVLVEAFKNRYDNRVAEGFTIVGDRV